jgi:hypothetical protein
MESNELATKLDDIGYRLEEHCERAATLLIFNTGWSRVTAGYFRSGGLLLPGMSADQVAVRMRKCWRDWIALHRAHGELVDDFVELVMSLVPPANVQDGLNELIAQMRGDQTSSKDRMESWFDDLCASLDIVTTADRNSNVFAAAAKAMIDPEKFMKSQAQRMVTLFSEWPSYRASARAINSPLRR